MCIRFGFFLSVITLLVFLTGCPISDPFAAYIGTNLISGKSLAAWAPVHSEVYSYVNYEDVTGTYSPPEEAPGADVYRLELKNLFPNGDFEASSVGVGLPVGWTTENGASTVEVINTGNFIDGKTMHFDSGLTDTVDYNIRNGAPDGFLENASYLIRFDYRSLNANIVFEYSDGTTSDTYWVVEAGDNTRRAFPSAIIAVSGSVNYFYTFGSLAPGGQRVQEAYIDNMRLVRTDISPKIKLDLKYSGDTVEPLISGSYRFSLYIKNDPSAGSANRFASESILLQITSGVECTGGAFMVLSGDWPEWTQVRIDCPNIQFPETPGDSTILSLLISPTDDSTAGNMDSGSILISSPHLEMFPDGFTK